jgi:hypothetical protein
MTNDIQKTVLAATVLLLAVGSIGCGSSVHSMRRGDWSGELALRGPIVDAEYAAQDAMLEHCGGRARVVVGAEAERAALADRVAPAREVWLDRTGRHVHYVCVSRAPSAFRTPTDSVGPVRADLRRSRPGF